MKTVDTRDTCALCIASPTRRQRRVIRGSMRHRGFNTIKEGEVRSGPDMRCWQAADPSSDPPCGRQEAKHGRHELKGGEWISWTTHSGLFSL